MRTLWLLVLAGVSIASQASFHSMRDVQRDGGVNTVTAMNVAGYINGSVCRQTALDINNDGMFRVFENMVKANSDYLIANGITNQGQSYINTMTSRYIFGVSLNERKKVCNRIYAPLSN